MGKGRNKRRKRKPRASWERSGHFNRHHIQPKSRGGTMAGHNLLIMDTNRHRAYHLLFGNLNFEEAAQLLLRCQAMKWSSYGLVSDSYRVSGLREDPES